MKEKQGKAGSGGKLNESLLHEYPAIGKYRVRVVRRKTRRSTSTMMDVREFVQSERFEGFTRRGIRLTEEAEVNKLRDALADAVARGWFELILEDKKADVA